MGTTPARLTRPTVGLMPTTPLLLAGHTMLPSVSVPIESAVKFAGAAAPEPELDPHGLRLIPYGLLHWPPRPDQPLVAVVERKLAHSLRVVFPRTTAPAARSAAATLVVELAGDLAGVGVHLDDGVHGRAALIDGANPAEVIVHQIDRAQLLLCHQRLQLDDGGFVQVGGRRGQRRQWCALQRGDGCGAHGQGAASELQCVTTGTPIGRVFRHRFHTLYVVSCL